MKRILKASILTAIAIAVGAITALATVTHNEDVVITGTLDVGGGR